MNGPELLNFLNFSKRIVVLDGLHFGYFIDKNREDFLLLLRRELELLRYTLSL